MSIFQDYYGVAGLPLPSLRAQDAIRIYQAHRLDPIMQPAPGAEDLRRVVEYCEYFIQAPCWTWPRQELAVLRAEVGLIRTLPQLTQWLRACRRIGIEPL